MNKAFHELAGFIFGDNEAVDGSGSVKIPMTSPVITEMLSERSFLISFVMPSHYTLDTLPKPNNPLVRIIQVAPQEMAAVEWKGAVPDQKLVDKKEGEMQEILHHSQYYSEGNPYLFEYDPPFTPSWMRNNEVLYKVRKIEHSE